jgi:hypothetical protein
MTEAASEQLHWTATWGDQVKVGDVVRVTKLGGPMRITQLRRFNAPPMVGLRPAVETENEHSWYYGAVVEDPQGREFHLFIKPVEAVFIATEIPKDLSTLEGVSGEH